MRAYSVFILCSDKDGRELKLSDFEFDKVVSINRLGEVNDKGLSDFNYDVRKMLRSHIVVTVGDWFECDKCKIAAQIARLMNLDIIHHSQYKTHVEANYN